MVYRRCVRLDSLRRFTRSSGQGATKTTGLVLSPLTYSQLIHIIHNGRAGRIEAYMQLVDSYYNTTMSLSSKRY